MVLAVIGFLLLPLLAFPDLLFGRQTLYWTDLSWIHYPRRHFAAAEWLAGRIPLWDPYGDTGVPLLAESQVGVLYPFSLIFLSPLPHSLELSLFILLHFSLAATFTLIWGRAIGFSLSGATLAGLSYGFGGVLMSQLCNLNIMTGAVWLPLMLYATHRLMHRTTLLTALLAGVPLALQILTAQPQIVFYSLVVWSAYWVYLLLSPSDDGKYRFSVSISKTKTVAVKISLLLLMLLSGLLLAAPQWLPTLEQQQLSIRDSERSFGFLTNTSWPPSMAVNLLLPSAFGNNVSGFVGDPFQEVFIYIGLLPLICVPFSWRQRHHPQLPFFGLLLIGGLLLAFGKYTPLYEWVIQHLPGFALFRIPARWLMVVNLALAMLAGLGLQTLLTDGLARRVWLMLTAAYLTLLLFLLTAWLFRHDALALVADLPEAQARQVSAFFGAGFDLPPPPDSQTWRRWFATPIILWLMNLTLAYGVLTLYHTRRLTAPTFAVAVILITGVDLALAGGTSINPTQPATRWHDLSGGARLVVEQLAENPQGAPEIGSLDEAQQALPAPPEQVADRLTQGRVFPLGMGSEAETVSHLGQYFPSVYRIRSAGGHGSSLRSARYEQFVDVANPVTAIQVLGVRYLLTRGQLGADAAATFPLVYAAEDGFVYEIPTPQPRAFIIRAVITAPDMTAALSHFVAGTVDPTRSLVIETTTPLPPLDDCAPRCDDTITLIRDEPQQVDLRVTLNQAGYLVLQDSYYPGWRATVNGQPTRIYPANVIGRAIYLPAGEQTVRFSYRPYPFWGGVGLAAGLVGVIVIVWGRTFTRRKRH